MSSANVVTLPDGSKCYSGPDCRRHGVQVRQKELETKIAKVLDSSKAQKKTQTEEEAKWELYKQRAADERYQLTFKTLQSFGLKKGYAPDFNSKAEDNGLVAIDIDENTILCVGGDDNGKFSHMGEQTFCRAWLFKDKKPVAMLRFSTYPKDYTPPPGEYPYVESSICDIEVRDGHGGNGYGLETIRNVEKHILDGRLIHSGGSYTPEGRKALGGKLPFTHEVRTMNKTVKEGKIPEASYRSMKFVYDWDNLHPEH